MLADATFHEQLLVFDRDLAAIAKSAGCGVVVFPQATWRTDRAG
jgi:hypothetical protein